MKVFFALASLIIACSLNVFAQNATPSISTKLASKKSLTLAVAKEIIAAAEREAAANSWNVSIAIVDDAGRLLHFLRMDSTRNATVEISIAKASHAMNYRRETKDHEEVLTKGDLRMLTFPGMLPVEGGVPLRFAGQVIGAIGVSGAAPDQDGRIARAGASLLEK